MKNSLNKIYPFQVWITAIVLGPVLIFVLLLLQGGKFNPTAFLSGVLINGFFGGILSLPTLLIYCLAFSQLVYFKTSEIIIKLLLALVSIVGMCCTLFFLGPDLFSYVGKLPAVLCYTLPILISSFLYTIWQENESKALPIT